MTEYTSVRAAARMLASTVLAEVGTWLTDAGASCYGLASRVLPYGEAAEPIPALDEPHPLDAALDRVGARSRLRLAPHPGAVDESLRDLAIRLVQAHVWPDEYRTSVRVAALDVVHVLDLNGRNDPTEIERVVSYRAENDATVQAGDLALIVWGILRQWPVDTPHHGG